MKTAITFAVAFGVAFGAASLVTAGTIPFRAVGPTLGEPNPTITCPSPSPTVTVTVDEEGNIVDELFSELPDAGSQDLGGVPEGEEPSPSPSPTLTPIPSRSSALDGDQGVSPSESAGDTAEVYETEGHSGGGAGESETGSAGDGPGLTPEPTIEESDAINSGEPDADAG